MNKKDLLIYAGLFAVGAGTGYGVAYFTVKKKYAAYAAEEIESVREAYAKAPLPKPSLEELAARRGVTVVQNQQAPEVTPGVIITTEGYASENDETDADAFRRIHGRVPTTQELIQMGEGIEPGEAIQDRNDNPDDGGIVEGNIFDTPQPDPEELGLSLDDPEMPPRDPERPYVISVEEWFQNETNYSQITLVYWADDDVLADDNNGIITDIDRVVGSTNLHNRFGYLSKDPDIVYVRNEKLKADYEVTKDDRNYGEIVHGISPDTSDVPRRMRSNDE
jgi:hypothetical protein